MQRLPKVVYTKEFRAQAVMQVEEAGGGVKGVAKRLLLPPSTLSCWVKADRAGKLGEIGKGRPPLTELEFELARTRRELVEVKMERDLLKKAAAYFAKGVK